VTHTEPFRRCYYDLLGSATAIDASGRPWRGKQNVFLSHSWGCPFMHLLQTIEAFEDDREGKSFYYYIDLFSLNQHNLTESEGRTLLYDAEAAADKAEKEAVAAVLLETLDRAVQTAECCLVAIDSYDRPAPLTRIWCLYEIWRASSVFAKPTVMGYPLEEARRFKMAVKKLEVDIDELVNTRVDVRNAGATVRDDLAMIHAKIEADIGLDTFNSTVRTKLTAHLVHCSIHTKKGSQKLKVSA